MWGGSDRKRISWEEGIVEEGGKRDKWQQPEWGGECGRGEGSRMDGGGSKKTE